MVVTFEKLGRYGRFANGAYQVCSTIGIARKNGFQFQFPLWKNHDHKESFGSTEDCDLYKHFVNPLPLLQNNGLPEQFIQWGYHNVSLAGNRSLLGHMQSRKYFDHCFDEVLHYMTMKNEYPKNDYTAIHIRRGDYDNNYHPRLGMEYYGRAIDKFPKGTAFMVFSDEPDSVADMLVRYYGGRAKTFKYVEKDLDYIESFKLMKSCRDFIIGNSSYSALAATLNRNAKVIAPANWFGPIAGLSPKDIYCPGWVVI